jgi:hypothetical protein
MSTNTKTAIPKGVDLHVLARLIEEGYGYASFDVRSYRLSGLASAEPSKAAN